MRHKIIESRGVPFGPRGQHCIFAHEGVEKQASSGSHVIRTIKPEWTWWQRRWHKCANSDLNFTCRSAISLDDLTLMLLDTLSDSYQGIAFRFDRDKDWYPTEDGCAANPICSHPAIVQALDARADCFKPQPRYLRSASGRKNSCARHPPPPTRRGAVDPAAPASRPASPSAHPAPSLRAPHIPQRLYRIRAATGASVGAQAAEEGFVPTCAAMSVSCPSAK
jgi:hypothetical protein